MRVVSVLVSVLVAGVSLAAAPARAQFGGPGSGMPGHRLVTFGVGGGVAVPVSDAKDAFKNGFNGLAYVRFQPASLPIAFAANVAFQRFDLSDAKVTTGETTTSITGGNSQLLAGIGDIKFDLSPRTAVHPYVIAGLGAYNVKTDPKAVGISSQSDTRFGINGAAGISIPFGAVSGFVQSRVDNVYTSDKGVINTKSIQVVPVTAGIEF